jgi:hypothetical protein
MKRALLAVLTVLALAPATADASYYMYRYDAQAATRQILSDAGYSTTSAQGCHPKNQNWWYRGVPYHKWVCYGLGDPDEYGDPDCLVRYVITGSGGEYDYYYRSTGHSGCSYGTG